jgi:hypothetical protein
MPKSGVLSRHHFLNLLVAPAIAKPAKQSSGVSHQSPLPGVCQPEFWFGEQVEFLWVDEVSGEQHSERGEVVGISRNFPEVRWEYQVLWLSSTAYPAEDYPNSDGSFWAANVFTKVM